MEELDILLLLITQKVLNWILSLNRLLIGLLQTRLWKSVIISARMNNFLMITKTMLKVAKRLI
ncbi:hypothetical protein BSAE_1759 [Bifidobacterium pullorum subsp. saeculare DSM 6531 = LMG 14934]|uniref:Uncharacterized protein n=1 Tax=Bifidobacterium pullorum subsp. saeculare DSM 6531 = LMG 14934 TaxID=1437611 RepID=A0A087CXX4_9BIFI|nr:hypothetical protein BSAE_1759 [Bifidobacterium pullorum subsp. saeculare DSM 6531 = LMG 14934]